MNADFESLAKKYGMNMALSLNGTTYHDHVTQMAYEMWQARQPEIDRLTQEVCDMTFAAKAFKSVLDKQKAAFATVAQGWEA